MFRRQTCQAVPGALPGTETVNKSDSFRDVTDAAVEWQSEDNVSVYVVSNLVFLRPLLDAEM